MHVPGWPPQKRRATDRSLSGGAPRGVSRSEHELDSELRLSRVTRGRRLPERVREREPRDLRRRRLVARVEGCAQRVHRGVEARGREVHPVEDVENFEAELRLHLVAQLDVLVKGQVHLDEVRALADAATRVSEGPELEAREGPGSGVQDLL